MGLAFWRDYHEQQQKEAEAQNRPVEEVSPLKALQLQQDPVAIQKAAEKSSSEKVAIQSHSRSTRARKAQPD